MGTETTELQARIKRLEDQLKIFRFVFVIVSFVLSSLVALQTRPRAIQTVGIVRAHQFAVVDDAGKTVAELSRENGSAHLVLYGASYKPAAEFSVAGSDPSIVFYDGEQKQRAILGMLVGAPTLAMHDAASEVRALLTADGNSSIFWVKDNNGSATILGNATYERERWKRLGARSCRTTLSQQRPEHRFASKTQSE